MGDKNTIVISTFPACGKSWCFNNLGDKYNMSDSDSSLYSWIRTIDENGEEVKVRNPDFPQNYIKHIKENIGKADVIFVSSHSIVRQALGKDKIKFTLVVPKKNCLNEWMIRYINRGNDNDFIDTQINNWDKWLDEIDEEKGTYSKLIKLEQRQYISDIIHKC